MTDMSPCRLCVAPFPSVIVRIVDAPALPTLPEFEDKWPNFVDSPLPSPPRPSRPAKKLYRIFPHQRTMPPTPPSSPQRLKPVGSDSTITPYDLHALSPLSPTNHLFIVTPSSDTSSLSDPSVHSPSDEDDDCGSSRFPSWHNSYDFPATPSASPIDLSPLYRCPSPSKFAFGLSSSMEPPSIPPRSSSRNSHDTSKSPRQPTPRSQAGPPLHFAAPRRAPPLTTPAFRHCATPPLPPPSLSKFAPQATIPPPRPSSYYTNTTSTSSSLPNSGPLTRAMPLPTSPEVVEKSVFDLEEESSVGLKGVTARFHGRGSSSGAHGGRRKSAGEVMKGIFGWSDKNSKGGKGT